MMRCCPCWVWLWGLGCLCDLVFAITFGCLMMGFLDFLLGWNGGLVAGLCLLFDLIVCV